MKSAHSNDQSRKLFVISGPSGVGRTTIIKTILKDIENIGFSVSYTSRERRCGEINHKDYHFVSEGTFKKLIDEGRLLEWARVFNHYYGTSKEEIDNKLENGEDVILDIDVQGASQLREKKREVAPTVFIFLAPPSESELKKRLSHRNTEDPAQLKLRLKKQAREMEHIPQFDYLVVNDKLNEAIRSVKSIILAERCKIDHLPRKQNVR